MKAVLQNFRSGELSVAEVPPPSLRAGGLLVRNVASLVSAGTERAVMQLARMNLLQKARKRPDLARKVLQRAGQEGLLATAQIIFNLVRGPLPLGYSCAGVVQEVGARVTGFQPGDPVACAGLGYANHAEVVYIPRNLAVPIPGGVSHEEAAFVTLGAIAMQGVRQAELAVGESVVVLGLGLVGQLVAQICGAAGCRVFGLDLDPSKVVLAHRLGAHDGKTLKDGEVAGAVRRFTRDRGADAILICAATPSNEPVALAAELARDRARVVAVGEVGLDVPRRAYYEKELELRQSRSYGPGRYDPGYEEHGHDYPLGYVRWTENRNMEAFLDLVAQAKVQVRPLITHRFPIDRAEGAYALLGGEGQEPYIGIVLEYDVGRSQPATISLPWAPVRLRAATGDAGTVRFGVVGAGQFAQGVLLPRLRKIQGVEIVGVATGSGHTARHVANIYRCRFCTSDYREVLEHPDIDALLIATRHDLHAQIASEALAAGKDVFVEKPLALSPEELSSVLAAYRASHQDGEAGGPILMVGYNRRFSPFSSLLKQAMRAPDQPLAISYRVNAGPVPAGSWVQDPKVGGGRIVGEVCHFVDWMQFLTEAEPVEVFASALSSDAAPPADPDNVSVQLRFSDGSLGTISYVANGDPQFPKERVEVFGGGRTAVIDNWRRLRVSGAGIRLKRSHWLAAAKGHREELVAFMDGVRSRRSPIPLDELILGMQATFAIQTCVRTGQPAPIHASGVA